MSKAIALLTASSKNITSHSQFHSNLSSEPTPAALAKHTAYRAILMNSPNRFTQQISDRKHR